MPSADMEELAALEALEKNPESAILWFHLGKAFHQKQKWQGAQEAYREALRRDPQLPEVWMNLGLVFRAQGQLQQAQECFQKALSLREAYPAAWTNLGNLLAFLGELNPALECHARAVALAPQEMNYILNRANGLTKAGELVFAQKLYEQVLIQQPNNVDAHWNLSHNLLLQGQFQRGFEEFEFRLQRPEQMPVWHAPKWDGSILPKGVLLVEAEQGFGDTLQFIRFVRLCAERVFRVVVRCSPRLQTLLRDVAGVFEVVSSKEAPPVCDAQVMMMSLPWILGLNSLPVFQPYLRACSERVESWAQRLPSTRWKIGICAEGSKDFEADALRSMGLSWFRDLASQEGVTCVSLQKKIEVSTVGFPLTVFSDLDAGKDAFLDTAALMQSLDLVVTSDTSVAHLAGALGRPVWVMLPFSPDWRWQLHSENSPWYPSMRLFRQAEPKNWHTPFADMREAFRRQYAGTF